MLACILQGGAKIVGPEHGLSAVYDAGAEAAGATRVETVDPQPSTSSVDAHWRGSAPAAFRVRWAGYLTVASAGDYVMSLSSDDQSSLTLDGTVVIDNNRPNTAQSDARPVALSKGPHLVVLELVQERGSYAMQWQWSRQGASFEEVPAWALTPAKPSIGLVLAERWLHLAARALLLLAAVSLAGAAVRSRNWVSRRPRAAALAFFVALSIVHTWPLATDPVHLTRHDNRDTILNQWILAWVAHEAVTSPTHLFDANIFYPERDTLAYSETMLVQSAMGAPLLWAGASPVLVYNLLLLAGFALTAWAMALVMYRWTSDWTAALVAGSVFGFCAHTLTRLPHLQAQHVEFLPFALLALDELLRRPAVGTALKLAAWSTLQALTSIYLLVITLVALTVAVAARPKEWLGSRALPFARSLAIGGAVAGLVMLPVLLPYYRVSHDQGLTRTLDDAAQYSASWADYLTTPARIHQWWSGPVGTGAGGMTGLFPGALGSLLAGIAVFTGIAWRDTRARMALLIGLAGLALSFGPSLPGYATLYAVVPILQAIRATARFGYLLTLAVAVLAGFGTVALRRLLSTATWRTAAPVLVVAAALEPLAAPLGMMRFEGIPPIYRRLATVSGAVVVEIPFHGPRSAQFHAHYMLNSTLHWRPLVNGYSGFRPASFYTHAEALQLFPQEQAFEMMRQIGVTHVFVHRAQFDAPALAALDARRDLERIDAFGDTVLYRLR